MKRMLAYIAVSLLLAGGTGIAQASGYNDREDCYTEGPPYNRESKENPIVTKIVDNGSRYIEGMGFAPRIADVKTIVPKVSVRSDFCSEGFSDEQLENILHIKKTNKILPAAGI